MISKLLASFVIFAIAIIKKFWMAEISKSKVARRSLLGLLLLSLIFSFYTIISDDIETRTNQNALKKMIC
jgi:hypothetical protein